MPRSTPAFSSKAPDPTRPMSDGTAETRAGRRGKGKAAKVANTVIGDHSIET